MTERTACMRDFDTGYGAGYGKNLSTSERRFTERSENFRIREGILTDLFGVERLYTLPRVPEAVYPAPHAVFGNAAVYYAGGKVYSYALTQGVENELFYGLSSAPRYSFGLADGQAAMGFATSAGVYVLKNGYRYCLTGSAGEDIAYYGGRWYFLSGGTLCMTKPYGMQVENGAAVLPEGTETVERIFVAGGKLTLLAPHGLYVLSGNAPENFSLTFVPVPERILCGSAAARSGELYFLTEKSVYRKGEGGAVKAADLPDAAKPEGNASGVVRGEYYFCYETGKGRREGLYDPEEKAAFTGSGRRITSFALLEEGGTELPLVAYGKRAVGTLTGTASVDGVALPKFWRSRSTDFGALTTKRLTLTGVNVGVEGSGRVRLFSEEGTTSVFLTEKERSRRLTLSGNRFTVELTSAAAGARFNKFAVSYITED